MLGGILCRGTTGTTLLQRSQEHPRPGSEHSPVGNRWVLLCLDSRSHGCWSTSKYYIVPVDNRRGEICIQTLHSSVCLSACVCSHLRAGSNMCRIQYFVFSGGQVRIVHSELKGWGHHVAYFLHLTDGEWRESSLQGHTAQHVAQHLRQQISRCEVGRH